MRLECSFFSRSRSRRGTVLVLVLVVSVILALSVFTFSQLMLSERKGASFGMRQKQARLLAESGVEWLRLFLSQDELTIQDRGDLYDNYEEFCGVIVLDGSISGTGVYTNPRSSGSVDPRDVGRFTILSPMLSEDGSLIGEGARYGLEDESSKINLHWIMQIEEEYPGMGRIILTRLPGVDEYIADALLDWMDEDDDPRECGAEYDYYELLDPPYYPKNAVPDSIDELLLVEGITPRLLYGIDWNRNGIWDIGEPDPGTLEDEFDVYDESLNLGLSAYLTVDSRESMLTPDGLSLKINVNSEDLDTLREDLLEVLENEEWVDYIIAYRQYGPVESTTEESSEGASSIEIPQTGSGGGEGSGSSGGNQGPQSPQIPQGGTGESGMGSTPDPEESGGEGQGGEQGGSAESSSESVQINSLLDLVGGSVQTDSETLTSPFSEDIDQMREYLPILYDYLTIKAEPMVGRININQVPRAVLEMLSTEFDDSDEVLDIVSSAMGIDLSMLNSGSDAGTIAEAAGVDSSLLSAAGISETTAPGSILEMLGIPPEEVDPLIEGILEYRISDPYEAANNEPDMLYPYWPYTLGITENLDVIKKIEPYFCTRGSVYRAQVVGRFDAKSPAVRFEVWIDAFTRPAKIIRIRELSELGPGYPPDMLGIDEDYGISRSY